MAELLFHEKGPGIFRPVVSGPYRAILHDGSRRRITHHVYYSVSALGTQLLGGCVQRVETVHNDPRAWPAVGVRWVHVADVEAADVAIEFYEVPDWNGTGHVTLRHMRGGIVQGYTIKLLEKWAFDRHEGMLHETGHCMRAYHMREWPDYPYSGVMEAKETEGDAWFSEDDLAGLRNYKRGAGKTTP